MSIRFFDMFAGIGGFRSGLEALGGFQCIGSCEIDTYARRAYETLYDTKGELFFADARTIAPEELPDIDLICGGFPCQSFSIAGKRLGFHDDARGTLFFEIARIAAAKRPALLLLENVPGLLSHDGGRTFAVILRTLDELGYDVAWKVLNSKDFGVPQARKRVYIAGFLSGECAGQILPDRNPNPAAVAQAIPGQRGGQGSRIYRSDGLSCTLTSEGGGFGGKIGLYEVGLPIKVNTKTGFQMAYPGDSIETAYATTNKRRGRVGHQIAHTLTTSDTQGCFAVSPYPVALNRQEGVKGVIDIAATINASDWRGLNRNQTQTAVVDMNAPFLFDFQDNEGRWHQGGIRKLTPREAWRLQGFTDEQFDRVAVLGLSDSRLYKMAGNAVTVPVISALGQFLMDIWTEGGDGMTHAVKTPVSWVGNKTAILPVLYSLFPVRYDRYIEPFGGSCAVLLGKEQADKFEVYNDFDHNLVNLFQCLRDRPLAFIRELGFLHLNARDDFVTMKRFFEKEEFDTRFMEQELELTSFLLPPLEAQELREVYTAVQRDYDLRRAAMYFKLIRMSYASTRKSFASQPFNLRCLFRLIRDVSLRLSNVVIENQDFGKLIEHYDRTGAFFYCDPPYVDTEDMYNGGFGWDDHVRLRETLGKIQGSFLLSYNDCPEVRELYRDFPFYSFERVHSMVQRYRPGEVYTEILIGNYDLMERQREQPMQLSLCDLNEKEIYEN